MSTQLDWINPVATLIAVFLASILSYLTASYLERRKERSAKMALAYALVFTVQGMTDDLVKLARCVQKTRDSLEGEMQVASLWRVLEDLIGFERRPSPTAEQLALVAMTRDVELLAGVQEIAAAHSIYIECLHRLFELRSGIDWGGLQTVVNGREISHLGTPEDAARINPTMIKLDDLSEAIENRIFEAAAEASKTSAKIGPHLKHHYKFGHFITMAVTDTLSHT